MMNLVRPFRIASLSRAEAARAEAHGGLRPSMSVTERATAERGRAPHFHPGKVEIMLMTGLK